MHTDIHSSIIIVKYQIQKYNVNLYQLVSGCVKCGNSAKLAKQRKKTNKKTQKIDEAWKCHVIWKKTDTNGCTLCDCIHTLSRIGKVPEI